MMPEMQYQIQQTEQQLATATQQLATGLRVNQLSDDPSAASAYVLSLAHSTNVDQYTSNGNAVLSQLQTADSAISTVVTSLTSAVTLGTQGANGTMNASDRSKDATQVEGLLQTVVSLANTSWQGAYIFGGSQQASAPFVQASTAFTSRNGSSSSPLSTSTALTTGSITSISDASTGQTFSFKAAAGDTIGTLETAIQNAVVSGTLSAGTDGAVDTNGQFQITSTAGMAVSTTDSVLGGMDPNAGSEVQDTYVYTGNNTVNQVQIGDATSIQANQSGAALFGGAGGAVNALTALISALKSGTSAQIAAATTNVNSAIAQLDNARMPISVSISRINGQETYLSQEKVTLTQQPSSLMDIDTATAATNLTQAQLANSAALAAAAKVMPQSLLDYLK
jgi:flagellar hook-associated protein 3